MFVCIYVCMYVSMYVYVCLYVFMYVCMYAFVRIYVRMHVYIHTHTNIHIQNVCLDKIQQWAPHTTTSYTVHTTIRSETIRFLGTAHTFARPQPTRIVPVGTLKTPVCSAAVGNDRQFTNAFYACQTTSQMPRDFFRVRQSMIGRPLASID